ncbi:MAG: phosphoribosylaminoimidazolesuccinocarboxamide synthase [Candidatus Aenigmatarchaeota archaeon]|nr:MAG: phosphoribosylaminoimidazolesuccinocarboxamide synthase [Candidatus Aenigmarchaeota archaeon]
MGSVKDVVVEKKPTETEFGEGYFEFRSDYSVFDYGAMPDQIPGKGEALCRMSAFNFTELAKLGLKSHFLDFIKPNRLKIKLVRVLYPGKDEITTETSNYLIPLEIIFRNSLPSGSSVFRALESGERTIHDFGLDHMPKPGEKLEKPIIDITTKLEVSDRRINWDEAKQFSALTDEEVERIKEIALKVNDFITKRAEEIGLEHADGKVELAFGPDREILLVDACGTPDENRFLLNGFHISKQILRDYYRKTPWYVKFEEAKKGLPKEQWPAPEKLPEELVNAAGDMYKAVCEMWTGEKVWGASLQDSISGVRGFL